MNNKVVYTHVRNDTGKVFYVGEGSLKRAYSTGGRNIHWNGIVNKYGYKVQILMDGLDKETALDTEEFFKALYGFENLCNMVPGRETSPGKIEGKEPWNKGKKDLCSKETRVKKRKGKIGQTWKRKPVVCTETGREWNHAIEVAKEFNINLNTLRSWLNGRRPNKSTFKYIEES